MTTGFNDCLVAVQDTELTACLQGRIQIVCDVGIFHDAALTELFAEHVLRQLLAQHTLGYHTMTRNAINDHQQPKVQLLMFMLLKQTISQQ